MEQYGIQEMTFLGGFHNQIYLAKHQEKPIIIRKTTKSGRRTLQEIQAEIDLLKTLHPLGFTIRPYEINGQSILVLADDVYVLFEHVAGKQWFEFDHSDETYALAGKQLALLHQTFHNLSPISRLTYDQHPDLLLLKKHPILEAEWNRIHAIIESWPKHKNEYGLIHGDYLYSNILYHDHGQTILDFDDCEYHFYLYDIAVYLFYYLLGGNPKRMDLEENQLLFQTFISHYQEHNPSIHLDFKKLPVLFRLRQLKLAATILESEAIKPLGRWQKDFLELTFHQIQHQQDFVPIFFKQ